MTIPAPCGGCGSIPQLDDIFGRSAPVEAPRVESDPNVIFIQFVEIPYLIDITCSSALVTPALCQPETPHGLPVSRQLVCIVRTFITQSKRFFLKT